MITIFEDFSHNVSTIRKNLWQSAAVSKANGNKVTLIFDKLKINNDLYSWDPVKCGLKQDNTPYGPVLQEQD